CGHLFTRWTERDTGVDAFVGFALATFAGLVRYQEYSLLREDLDAPISRAYVAASILAAALIVSAYTAWRLSTSSRRP
ncbi:MAG: hypothetical protein KDA42_13595, partial [Planctomycetales bacterium]|nr:hypothetical protein [Planctomycetales bacterium]